MGALFTRINDMTHTDIRAVAKLAKMPMWKVLEAMADHLLGRKHQDWPAVKTALDTYRQRSPR